MAVTHIHQYGPHNFSRRRAYAVKSAHADVGAPSCVSQIFHYFTVTPLQNSFFHLWINDLPAWSYRADIFPFRYTAIHQLISVYFRVAFLRTLVVHVPDHSAPLSCITSTVYFWLPRALPPSYFSNPYPTPPPPSRGIASIAYF